MNKVFSVIKRGGLTALSWLFKGSVLLMAVLGPLAIIAMLIGAVCNLPLLISIGSVMAIGFLGCSGLCSTIALTYLTAFTISNCCMLREIKKRSANAVKNTFNKERSAKELAQMLTNDFYVGWYGRNLSESNFPFVCFSDYTNLASLKVKVQNTVMLGASQRQADGSYLTLKKLKEEAGKSSAYATMVTTAKELEKALEGQRISLERAQTLFTFFMQMKDLMTDKAFLKQRPDIEQNQTEYKEEVNGAITALSTFIAKKVRGEVAQTSQRVEKNRVVDKTLSTEKGIKECSYEELVFKVNYYLPREIHSQIFAKTFLPSVCTVPVIQHQLYQQSLMKNKAPSWSVKQNTSFVFRVSSFFAGKKEDSMTPLLGRV